ncbi:helix-turn-helix transcriptional regulator [Rhizobium sp. BK251]|uniref:helix-turn-helix transcriptional regulator n=1 Tax=Rhizobium sp. BK251 TaxID=2512125 RepID=UPI00105082A3|nr:helix-turn-helix transcriptional regulator [Rhizobium sp. BK251]TCL75670.1 DNA-binding CsgD family transcriptional regulator [Rhizobium sp. BK251]
MPTPIDKQLEPLTDLVYGALLGETTWQHFLDALNETMPEGRSTLFFHDSVAKAGAVCLTSGLTQKDSEDYNSHYSKINPWMPRAAVRPVGLGVVAEQMLDRKQLLKTEFYHGFVQGIGCESSVGVTIMREHGRSFNLSTLTASRDVELNRIGADRLTALAPHLKRAFEFVRRHQALGHDRAAAGQSLFDAVDVGLVYVTENQKVRSLNKVAERILAASGGITVNPSNRIVFESMPTNDLLASLTQRMPPEAAMPHSTVVKGPCGTLKCTFVRLQSDFITEFLDGPTVALIIEQLGTAAEHAWIGDELVRRYRLTSAEMRIASGIVAGMPLREVALASDVSYETARSQLKSVFSKLGVNSQVGLVRLLMP